MLRIIRYVIKKIGFSELLTVPPQSEFHTKEISVSNKTDNCLEILTRNFPDRRKEDRRDDTLGIDNTESGERIHPFLEG